MLEENLIRIIPGLAKRNEILNELVPPKLPELYGLYGLEHYVTLIFGFRHENLCAAHWAAYIQLIRENEKIDLHYEEVKKIAQRRFNEDITPEDREAIEYKYFRGLEAGTAQEHFLLGVKAFTDQNFIVGLWAIVEQSIAKLLLKYSKATGKAFNIPYKWGDFMKIFRRLGVNTDQSLPIYCQINELRVLNNKIKHLNEVDEELATFPFFQNLKHQNLDRLNLELQRYSDYAFAFTYFIADQLICDADLIYTNQ